MGCANSKTGAAAAAPEGEGAPPKVEGEEGGAANGNAVTCSNGAEESAGGEKEACNGDAQNNDATEATSGGDGEKKTEQNGEAEESTAQDGGEAKDESAESTEKNEEGEKAE